jgi:hypothetical protein
MWKLVDLNGRSHVFVIGMIMEDVVLDLVVGRKPKLAVRALTWYVLHGLIVRRTGRQSPETSVPIGL